MLEGTKSVSQLLEEESREEPIQILSEEENDRQFKRDYINMVKVISLSDMNANPLSNPSFFRPKEKKKLQQIMKGYIGSPIEEIRVRFNEVCNDEIFTYDADYATFPINRFA
jgi:hypothetical protein